MPSTNLPVPPMPAGGEKFGAWFDARAADMAAAFFPAVLRHTEAEWAGKPFHPADWQRDRLIRPLFGWKRADGTRLIRTVFLMVPRKNGKTELAAGVSILALLADGEHGGQVYSMAADKDQAKIVFDKAGVMIGFSERLRTKLEVYKTSIFCPRLMAAFKPLSKSANTKHGFSPTAAIADEIHAWPDGEVHQVVRDGMAARRQPIEILITTAGVVGQGYGWEVYQYALKVRDGILEDPTFLPVIYAADPDDDWRDEATWAKANPNLGVSVKLEFLREQAMRARDSARLEGNFRRYHLNQWTDQAVSWISMEAWDETGQPIDPESLRGRECYGGLDLSRTIDITAFVLAFPPREEGELWKCLCWFWVPRERIGARVRTDRVPYDQWVKDGLITATPGNVVDYRRIFGAVLDLAEIYVIKEIGFDPWNATQLAQELEGEGFIMVQVRQGGRSMSEPMKYLEGLVLERQLAWGGNPVLRWMASNITIRVDPNENIAPDKAKSTERIDGMVALINALARAMFHDQDKDIAYEAGQMFL